MINICKKFRERVLEQAIEEDQSDSVVTYGLKDENLFVLKCLTENSSNKIIIVSDFLDPKIYAQPNFISSLKIFMAVKHCKLEVLLKDFSKINTQFHPFYKEFFDRESVVFCEYQQDQTIKEFILFDENAYILFDERIGLTSYSFNDTDVRKLLKEQYSRLKPHSELITS